MQLWLHISVLLNLVYICHALSHPFDYNPSPRDTYDVIEDRFLLRIKAFRTSQSPTEYTNLSAIDILAYRHQDTPELLLSTAVEMFDIMGCFDKSDLDFQLHYPFGSFTMRFNYNWDDYEWLIHCRQDTRAKTAAQFFRIIKYNRNPIIMQEDISMNRRDRELWQTRAKFSRYGVLSNTLDASAPLSWFNQTKKAMQPLSRCSPDYSDPGFVNWCDSETCWYHVNFNFLDRVHTQTNKVQKCPVFLIFGANSQLTNVDTLSQIRALQTSPTFNDSVKVYRNDGRRIHGSVTIDLASGILRVFHRPTKEQPSGTFEFGHGIGLASPGYRFFMTGEHTFTMTFFNDDYCEIKGKRSGSKYYIITSYESEGFAFEEGGMFVLFLHKGVITVVATTRVMHIAVKFCNREFNQPITNVNVSGEVDVDFVIYPNIVFIERVNATNTTVSGILVADEDGTTDVTATTVETKEVYVSLGVFLGVIIVEVIVLIITCIVAPICRYKYDRKREKAEANKPFAASRIPPPPSIFAAPYKDGTTPRRRESTENVKPLIPDVLPKYPPSRETLNSQNHQMVAVDQQAAPIDYNVLTRTWLLPQDFWALFPVESTCELPVLALDGDARNESIFFFLRDVTQHEDAIFNHVESRLNETGADFGPMPTIYREKDIPQSEFNLRDPFTIIRAFVIGHAPLHLELYFNGIVPHFVSEISPNCNRCEQDANKSFLITDASDLKAIVENLPHGYHLRVAISDHHDLSVTSKRTTVVAIRFGMPFELPPVVHYASLYHRNTQNRKHIASNKITNYRDGLKALVRVPGPAPESEISAALLSKKEKPEKADSKEPDLLASASLENAEPTPDTATK